MAVPEHYIDAGAVAGFLREVLGHLRGRVIVVWDGGSNHKGPAVVMATRPSRPECPGFNVEVLVAGRPLVPDRIGDRRSVRAVEGADYELRITNPLPVCVAAALSVDGLNTIDARRTGDWDASKWLIRPHQTITVGGWQVGSERARRFYFTTERDSYAAKLGRPADFGVIRAVFFRERRPAAEITPRPSEPSRVRREGETATEALASPPADGSRERRGPDRRLWCEEDRAATGMGRTEPHEVCIVAVGLERQPVAEVDIRYAYHPVWHRPEPWPLVAPAPVAPSRRDSATGIEGHRFCPEP
jgi:hypothetical protein